MIHPILKKKIEIRLGQKVLNRGDCELLSNLILETIDIEISYNTIRRLFGLAVNVKASKKTLNTLAKFVGYKNYIHFMQTHLEEETQNLSILIFRVVYQADKAEVIKKMIKFVNTHDYTLEQIFQATRDYVERFSLKGYAYMQQAHYFIEKRGVGSTLSAECEGLAERSSNSKEEGGDYGRSVK